MDYLTIIATRSVILFPNDLPAQPLRPRALSTSSAGSPVTPTTPLPEPVPVCVPIYSLLYAETDCAYYLLTHVLSHPNMFPNHATGVAVGGVSKDIAKDAEVMVWKEIDKGKMFIRSLGQWFAHAQHQRISEEEMEQLGHQWGVGIKHQEEEQRQEGEEKLIQKVLSHVSEDTIVLA